MENNKYIDIKDIKENNYIIKILKLQYQINNFWFELFDFNRNNLSSLNNLSQEVYKCIIDNLIIKQNNINIKENNLNNYIEIINYPFIKLYSYSINSYILCILSYYIFNYEKDKKEQFIKILNDNIVYIKYNNNYYKDINKIYFNKNLFEEIKKLNLDLQICLEYLNSKDKIINIYNDNINNKTLYLYSHNDKNNSSLLYYSNGYPKYLLYKEKLIIKCNNNENKKEIKDEIKELKEKIEKLEKENEELKEYKDKFDKINLFLKN